MLVAQVARACWTIAATVAIGRAGPDARIK